MTYKTWMDETKRGVFTPRSTPLKNLDAAFKAKDLGQSPFLEIKLAEMLKVWLDTKGTGWKSSTRNSTKVDGKGTVERLVEDLSANSICRAKLGNYASQQAPEKDHFVSAHGARGTGTSTGTFVVPKGLEIHFYCADATVLPNSLAIPLYNDLTRPIGYGRICDTFVKRIAKQLEQVPNYIAYGAEHLGVNADPVFKGYPTGVYEVGKNIPKLAIPAGAQMKLSEIIYAKKPNLTGCFHWLCCMENMNPNRVVQAYTPSEVIFAGGVWRD